MALKPGALTAFGLARVLGHDALRRVFGTSVDAGRLGSLAALTVTVFASRLQAWRFALVALAGIIPASFLLGHFGGEAASRELGAATWAVLGVLAL